MKNVVIFLIMLGLVFLMASRLFAWEPVDIERLATAIHKAEGNDNYGILKHIKGNNFRKACIQTIQKRISMWNGNGDFIDYLSKTYCPIGAKNDPNGLNKNWPRLVRYFYAKGN